MWNLIFAGSLIAYVIGLFVFLLGEHLVPGWSPVTLPLGAAVAGLSGLAVAVSGIAVILSIFHPRT